jgi:hypothetical protein
MSGGTRSALALRLFEPVRPEALDKLPPTKLACMACGRSIRQVPVSADRILT